MEPRPYQAEAFDAARKANVVMVGATGVGKVSGEKKRAVSIAQLVKDTCWNLNRRFGLSDAAFTIFIDNGMICHMMYTTWSIYEIPFHDHNLSQCRICCSCSLAASKTQPGGVAGSSPGEDSDKSTTMIYSVVLRTVIIGLWTSRSPTLCFVVCLLRGSDIATLHTATSVAGFFVVTHTALYLI